MEKIIGKEILDAFCQVAPARNGVIIINLLKKRP